MANDLKFKKEMDSFKPSADLVNDTLAKMRAENDRLSGENAGAKVVKFPVKKIATVGMAAAACLVAAGTILMGGPETLPGAGDAMVSQKAVEQDGAKLPGMIEQQRPAWEDYDVAAFEAEFGVSLAAEAEGWEIVSASAQAANVDGERRAVLTAELAQDGKARALEIYNYAAPLVDILCRLGELDDAGVYTASVEGLTYHARQRDGLWLVWSE